MKRLLTFFIIIGWVVGCSSGPKAKETDTAVANAEATQQEATAKADATVKAGEQNAAATTAAATANATAPAQGEIKCTYGSEERAISITPQNGGCEVNYVRNGESRVIGNANNEVAHCQQIADRVVSNLKNNGFTCTP